MALLRQICQGAQLPEMCFACLGGWMSRSLHDEARDPPDPPETTARGNGDFWGNLWWFHGEFHGHIWNIYGTFMISGDFWLIGFVEGKMWTGKPMFIGKTLFSGSDFPLDQSNDWSHVVIFFGETKIEHAWNTHIRYISVICVRRVGRLVMYRLYILWYSLVI